MKIALVHFFVLYISFGFSQNSLFGKYEPIIGYGILNLNIDSTYNYGSHNCIEYINKNGNWTVKNDSLYTFYYQINPVSLEFDTAKTFTDTFWIDKKNNRLYLILNQAEFNALAFRKLSNLDLVYLKAKINGFNNCFKRNTLDFIEIKDVQSSKDLYEIQNCKVQFFRNKKILYQAKQKGNKFSNKTLNKYLKLQPGDYIKISKFSILKNNKLFTNFKLQPVIHYIN